MDAEKCCERCGDVIASMWDTNWNRYIRLKYCPECRRRVKLDQTNECRRQKRKAVREAKKLAKRMLEKEIAENERLRVLKRENEQLRKWLGSAQDSKGVF